jgi:hypothetical protein
MGKFNSSVTRVWPVFDTLFSCDPTGSTWLNALLKLGHLSDNASASIFETNALLLPELGLFTLDMPGPLARELGSERMNRHGKIRTAFERDIPPSKEFLRWLINHPDRLVWPCDSSSQRRRFSERTTELREKLMDGDRNTQQAALGELERCGAYGSRRRWWAFEGFTSVDCLLETKDLLVFIEGKRTEGISKSTDWFPLRNQVLRNLEVAREMAGESKEYAVLLCAEKHLDLPENSWQESLPHCSEREVADLKRHYLGCATWDQIVKERCPDLKLPHTLDEAIACCAELRDKGSKS